MPQNPITQSYEPFFLNQSQQDRQLLIAFFFQFARFEFAMKRAGYIRTDNNEGALANWDKLFAEKAVCNYFANLNDKALQDAIQYYLTYSPKTQVYDSSKKLSYRRIDLSKHSESYQLGVLVRYTRNNLFHGGKFGNNVPIKFRPQDVLLMKYGPVILNACLLAVPTFEKILLIWLALP